MTHQKRPEPLGMLLSVSLLNLDAETVLPDTFSKAIRSWDRLTGSTAGQQCHITFDCQQTPLKLQRNEINKNKNGSVI